MVVSSRMWRLGLTCPNEKLQAKAVALVLGTDPETDPFSIAPQAMRSWQETVQSNIKAMDRGSTW
eukprot:6637186-Pyramimonas_sp.AAC.1